MPDKRRKFDREFREDAVRLVNETREPRITAEFGRVRAASRRDALPC